MNAITVRNLTKSYGTRTILNGLDFTIKEGEFVAIIGPSGSGKSTLLNILGMMEEPSAGQIELFNQPLPKINSRKATLLRRSTINYLFQSFALISDMTVKENLLWGMKFVKKSQKQKLEKIKQVLTDLDISHLSDDLVNTLSGGEQQRVSLARASLKPCKVILADEPTGALDPLHAQDAFDQIRQMQLKYGKTVIMVTHNHAEAKKADRIIALDSINKF